MPYKPTIKVDKRYQVDTSFGRYTYKDKEQMCQNFKEVIRSASKKGWDKKSHPNYNKYLQIKQLLEDALNLKE